MPQVKLNKATLSLEKTNLKNYKIFLPSLDLKRRKLIVEKNKTLQDYEKSKQQLKKMENELSERYPMAAVKDLEISNLISIEAFETSTENIVGVVVPAFNAIKFKIGKYDYFNTPHWFESFIDDLTKMIETRLRLKVAEERVKRLIKATQVVTQRKNLFEKILIPKSQKIIKNIQIFLSDNERARVVSSKIAKKKRQVE